MNEYIGYVYIQGIYKHISITVWTRVEIVYKFISWIGDHTSWERWGFIYLQNLQYSKIFWKKVFTPSVHLISKRHSRVRYLLEELEGDLREIPKKPAYWIYHLVYFWTADLPPSPSYLTVR